MILEMFIIEFLFTITFGSNVQLSHNGHFLCLGDTYRLPPTFN